MTNEMRSPLSYNSNQNEKRNEMIEGYERGLKETHTHCVIQLTPKTVLEISSKEGREWGFDCKHAETS